MAMLLLSPLTKHVAKSPVQTMSLRVLRQEDLVGKSEMTLNPRRIHVSELAIRFGTKPVHFSGYFGPVNTIKERLISPKSIVGVREEKSWKPPLENTGRFRGAKVDAFGRTGDVLVIEANYEIPEIFESFGQLSLESDKGVNVRLKSDIPSAILIYLLRTNYVDEEEGKENILRLVRPGIYHALEKTRGRKREGCTLSISAFARFTEHETQRYLHFKKDDSVRKEFMKRLERHGLSKDELKNVMEGDCRFVRGDFYCLSLDGKNPWRKRRDNGIFLIPRAAYESGNGDISRMVRFFPALWSQGRGFMDRLSFIPYGIMYSVKIYTNIIQWEDIIFRHYLLHDNNRTRERYAKYLSNKRFITYESGTIFDTIENETSE
jgi:hypothetical protein